MPKNYSQSNKLLYCSLLTAISAKHNPQIIARRQHSDYIVIGGSTIVLSSRAGFKLLPAEAKGGKLLGLAIWILRNYRMKVGSVI